MGEIGESISARYLQINQQSIVKALKQKGLKEKFISETGEVIRNKWKRHPAVDYLNSALWGGGAGTKDAIRIAKVLLLSA